MQGDSILKECMCKWQETKVNNYNITTSVIGVIVDRVLWEPHGELALVW